MVRLVTLLLLATTHAAAQRLLPGADPVATASRIDALVEPHAAAGLASGVIVVARGEDVLIERSYGHANRELRVPNSVSTRFGVGSIRKAMTWALVALLSVEGGRLVEVESVRLCSKRDCGSNAKNRNVSASNPLAMRWPVSASHSSAPSGSGDHAPMTAGSTGM